MRDDRFIGAFDQSLKDLGYLVVRSYTFKDGEKLLIYTNPKAHSEAYGFVLESDAGHLLETGWDEGFTSPFPEKSGMLPHLPSHIQAQLLSRLDN